MLYQLSYASTLKPGKNSIRGLEIAIGAQKYTSKPLASAVEKDRGVTCLIRLNSLIFLSLPFRSNVHRPRKFSFKFLQTFPAVNSAKPFG
jgi:hypothetical protein